MRIIKYLILYLISLSFSKCSLHLPWPWDKFDLILMNIYVFNFVYFIVSFPYFIRIKSIPCHEWVNLRFFVLGDTRVFPHPWLNLIVWRILSNHCTANHGYWRNYIKSIMAIFASSPFCVEPSAATMVTDIMCSMSSLCSSYVLKIGLDFNSLHCSSTYPTFFIIIVAIVIVIAIDFVIVIIIMIIIIMIIMMLIHQKSHLRIRFCGCLHIWTKKLI